jgi:hypothetical protein
MNLPALAALVLFGLLVLGAIAVTFFVVVGVLGGIRQGIARHEDRLIERLQSRMDEGESDETI